jgi:hypothetical protein
MKRAGDELFRTVGWFHKMHELLTGKVEDRITTLLTSKGHGLFKSSEQTGTGINQSPPDFTFHTQYTILGQGLFYGLHRTAHGGADRVMIPGHDTLEYSTIAPQVEGELVVPTR